MSINKRLPPPYIEIIDLCNVACIIQSDSKIHRTGCNMHYQDAIEGVRKSYCDTWGSFHKELPCLRELSDREIKIFFHTRLRVMDEIMKKNMVGFHEFSRFIHEFDVVSLMLVLCLSATKNAQVNFSSGDLELVESEMHNLCVAGVWEYQNVRRITRRLLKEIEGTSQILLKVTVLSLGPISN